MTKPTMDSPTLLAYRDVVIALIRTEGERGLSIHQQAVLLAAATIPGPLSVIDVARRLNVAKSVVTRALDRLADLGMILRARDPNDLRRIVINVRPAGAAYTRTIARLLDAGLGERPTRAA
jgi:DNA-binding MarR family transcriptional regulator